MNWPQHTLLDYFLKTSFTHSYSLFPSLASWNIWWKLSISFSTLADKNSKTRLISFTVCMLTDLRWAFNFSQQNHQEFFQVGCFVTLQDNSSVPSYLFSNFPPLLHTCTWLTTSPISHWENTGHQMWTMFLLWNLNSCFILLLVFSCSPFVTSREHVPTLSQSWSSSLCSGVGGACHPSCITYLPYLASASYTPPHQLIPTCIGACWYLTSLQKVPLILHHTVPFPPLFFKVNDSTESSLLPHLSPICCLIHLRLTLPTPLR